MIELYSYPVFDKQTNKYGFVQIEHGYFEFSEMQNLTAEPYSGTKCTIDQDIAELKMNGYLPIGTVRENLYQVLFALNASIKKNADGSMHITWLNSENYEQIPRDNIYNEGTVKAPDGASRVDVTEHYYYADTNAERVTLYSDESTNVSNKIIYFENAPIITSSIQYTGTISIIEQTVNFAKISGQGTITGIPYTHIRKINSITNNDALAEKVISVNNATMVDGTVSNGIKARLMNFYRDGKKINNSILHSNESCGENYTFVSPFEETEAAILSKMDLSMSSVEKANCEFISGFTPNGGQGIYTHYDIVTGNGTYTFPVGTLSAKLILIGGGGGGEAGANGTAGSKGPIPSGAKGDGGTGNSGKGGESGRGGLAGNSFSIDLQTVSGSFTYSCGLGGSYYSRGGTPTHGTDTEITLDGETYSTAFGTPSSVINPITHDIYCAQGPSGHAGGNGGYTRIVDTPRPNYPRVYSASGAQDDSFTKGSSGSTSYYEGIASTGGAGGGGSYGRCASSSVKGGQGGDGSSYHVSGSRNAGDGGTGGSGGNAIANDPALYPDYDYEIPPVLYGCGGNGGNGGGGGGAGGAVGSWYVSGVIPNDYRYYGGSGGAGGTGGRGSKGGDGAILILY